MFLDPGLDLGRGLVSLNHLPGAATTTSACPTNCRTTTGETDTTTADVAGAEHGGVPQHIRHNKESHMTAPDVNLFEMADAPIAGCDGDVLELDVHVVLGFNKLATVGLAGGDLEGDDMTLSLIEKLDGNTNCGSHFGGCVVMSWGFWMWKGELVLGGLRLSDGMS